MNAPPEMRRAPGKAPLKNRNEITNSANLTPLADECNRLYGDIYSAGMQMVEKAAAIGQHLLDVRESLPIGVTLKAWVSENCVFSYSTAKDYMRIARGRDRLAKDSVLSLPSLRSAIKLLATPKAEEVPGEDGVPHLADVLAERGGVWISTFKDGVRLLFSSRQHPGHAFVDEVNLAEGWLGTAQRPFRFDALSTFFPGTYWLDHSQVDGAEAFVREYLPERVADMEVAAPA